jgi:hypothetical protein
MGTDSSTTETDPDLDQALARAIRQLIAGAVDTVEPGDA